MNNPIHILQKNGYSFFKKLYYSNFVCYWVNGDKKPEICPGNNEWMQFKGDINKLEIECKEQTSVISYDLKPEFLPLNNSDPATYRLSVPFSIWQDEIKDEDYTHHLINFYNGVLREEPNSRQELPILVIDRDCEPISMIAGIKINFPHDLQNYPETWHKYPCSIDGDSVFNHIVSKAKSLINKNPDRYTVKDYINIGAFSVREKIKITFPKTKKVSYYPGLKSKKMVERTVPDTYIEVELVDLYAPRYKDGSGHIMEPSISGDNYSELLKKLEEYTNKKILMFDDKNRCICPECKGAGVIEVRV